MVVAEDKLVWHRLALLWRLAQPGQTLEQARPDAQLRSWRQLVTYHDLVEQAFGLDLTATAVGENRVVPLLSRARPGIDLYPSEHYPRGDVDPGAAFARYDDTLMDDGTLLVFRDGTMRVLDDQGQVLWDMAMESHPWADVAPDGIELAFVEPTGWFGLFWEFSGAIYLDVWQSERLDDPDNAQFGHYVNVSWEEVIYDSNRHPLPLCKHYMATSSSIVYVASLLRS